MAKPSKRTTRGGKRRRRSNRSGVVGVFVLVALLTAIGIGGGLLWLWPRCAGAECPSVEALREYTPPQASRVLDGEGELLAHLAPERRIVVPLERIPAHLSGAFLSVEDKRFFSHGGVDLRRAFGALVRDVQSGSFRQGFSTITMQLARNVFPKHLTREKTLRRKVWEIVLAREIEEEFGKDEILELYLNQIYLGNGLYGVEAAAEGYFGKSAAELEPVESALLAALPKAPSNYDPRRRPTAALARRNLVLRLMAEEGIITKSDAAFARGEPLRLTPPMEARGVAPYFVAAIRRELRERFGPDAETAGLTVRTRLDSRLQAAATTALREQLASVEADQLGDYRGPTCSGNRVEDPRACLQGLFVALDARNGDVLALVGGRDFGLSQFDRVSQARRQAGSAFKPIVYATALAAGIPITTPLVGPDVADYEGGYDPADHVDATLTLNLREALRLSSNRAAVALGERAGVREVVRTAKDLGFTTPIPAYPSTFLGAADVVPIELVAAYTAFANHGTRSKPRLIQRVEGPQGRLIWEAEVEQSAALSPEVAFLTTSLMRDVVDRGTGWRVREAGVPYAVAVGGKTGTTNEAADTWFVGVTPDIAAGVWIGFDQPRRIMRGADGGKLAAPVWGRAVAEYYRTHPAPAPWTPPAGLLESTVDAETGMIATAACPPDRIITEWFLPDTEPVDYCTLHPEPGLGGWFRRRMRDFGDLFGGDRRDRDTAEIRH